MRTRYKPPGKHKSCRRGRGDQHAGAIGAGDERRLSVRPWGCAGECCTRVHATVPGVCDESRPGTVQGGSVTASGAGRGDPCGFPAVPLGSRVTLDAGIGLKHSLSQLTRSDTERVHFQPAFSPLVQRYGCTRLSSAASSFGFFFFNISNSFVVVSLTCHTTPPWRVHASVGLRVVSAVPPPPPPDSACRAGSAPGWNEIVGLSRKTRCGHRVGVCLLLVFALDTGGGAGAPVREGAR